MSRIALARSCAIGLAAIFVGPLAAPLICAEIAFAQEPPPVRMRGTIERVDGAIYVVKARDGVELKLKALEQLSDEQTNKPNAPAPGVTIRIVNVSPTLPNSQPIAETAVNIEQMSSRPSVIASEAGADDSFG